MQLTTCQWYAAQVRSSLEKHVATALREKGYESFLPLCTRRRRWSDRAKTDEAPLFPGYVFFRVVEAVAGPVYPTHGVIRLVGSGRYPLAIPDSEIVSLQRAIAAGRSLVPTAYLATGDKVRVIAGALNGIEGHLVSFKSRDRLVLSIDLLQRSAALEIDRYEVEPIRSQVRTQLLSQ